MGFIATSDASSKRFEDIDLSDGEWADYDDDGHVAVGVYELESQVVTA